ncbi:MAG TPA: hypothetical protein VIL85_27375 [Thermomicrobiales bacterium]|jgi:hypothetical protein
MAEPTMRDVLDRLTTQDATVVALHRTVQEQGAELARYRQRKRRGRTMRRILPLALAGVLVALLPLSILAANPFNDLVPGSVHNANIDAIYNAGITTGCDPNVSYCPTDLVTRQEMASFLARTAGLGENPPVANAKTAQTATNADKLGGRTPGELLRVAQTSAGPVGDTTVAGDNSWHTVRTVTVVAPGPGFLLVTGSALLHSGTTSKYLRVSSAGVASTEATAQLGIGAGQTSQASLSQTFAFPVAAAGTQTVALEVESFNSAVTVRGATLTAVFIPFGYNGGTTLAP